MKRSTHLRQLTLALGGIAFLVAGCDKPEPELAGGPAPIKRLTEEQYRNSIADIFGKDLEIGGRFEPEIRAANGLIAIGSATASYSPSGMEQYDARARAIADQVFDEKRRATLLPCTPASETAPDEACATATLKKYGRLLFRRPLTEEEVKEHVDLATRSTQRLGNYYGGASLALATMMVSPNFLFRIEQSEPDPDASGKARLNAYSKASRLSFFFWNTSPDEELLQAAEKGDLQNKGGLKKQVERLIASPRLEVGTRAFFADVFAFDAFANLSKDAEVYPKFSQPMLADAREQTFKTVVNHLLVKKADYRDLYTTKDTFLNRRLGSVYVVPIRSKEEWEPYTFSDKDNRAGLLTHISFLALHAHPGRSSPTLRGKALRELLLCQPVPLPPANVDFSIAEDTHNDKLKTARDRLLVHQGSPVCAGCHKITDPIGFTMEHYDGIGEYRMTENGASIDASGDLDGKKVTNAVDLGTGLRNDPATVSCLVQRTYAYGVGRHAAPDETEWLNYLKEDFAANGHVYPELLKTIALSKGFYRVAAESATDQTASNTKVSNEERVQ